MMRQAETAGIETLQQILNLLVVREVDLRHTLHPRLLLETLMIKLCHIGDILSFEQLIQKIASLEKRLTAPAGLHEGSPGPALSDPPADWEKREKSAPPLEPPPERPVGNGWEDFLNYLSQKNRAMANVLRQWHMESLDAHTLELAKAGNAFSSAYLDESERMERLMGYCRDFFGREMKIKISEKAPEKQGARKRPGKQSSGQTQPKDQAHPAPVQDILEMFRGTVKKEIPLKDRSE